MAQISIRGARANSLQGVDLQVPLNTLVTVTGPSGSGKSSLAFDTIFAEGQRRLVELLSPGSRRLAERLPRPAFDLLEGLPPTLACEQSPPHWGPYANVATAIDIMHPLALLFIRCGQLHCPSCDALQEASTVPAMVDRLMRLPDRTRFVLGVVLWERGEELAARCKDLVRDGFTRLQVDNEVVELASVEGTIAAEEIVLQVDRLVRKEGIESRLADSLELALRLGGGRALAQPLEGEPIALSMGTACHQCGEPTPVLSTSLLSFRSAEGRCEECGGLGERAIVDAKTLVPDTSLSLAEGCIAPWAERNQAFFGGLLEDLCQRAGIDFHAPWKSLSASARSLILFGETSGEHSGDYRGVVFDLEKRLARALSSDPLAGEGLAWLQRFLSSETCTGCGGTRLSRAAKAARLGGVSIAEVYATPLAGLDSLLASLLEGAGQPELGASLRRGIARRLEVADALGLSYLPVGRGTKALSSGEQQRLRLVELLSTQLQSVLFVLDEPSAGLHAQDTAQLLDLLSRVVAAGNSVLMVEHDRQLIEASEQVIDMGPGAGRLGGQVVAQGPVASLEDEARSLTGAYLAHRLRVEALPEPSAAKTMLQLSGASANNLRDVCLQLPMGQLSCLVGLSGAGKSSLLMGSLLPAIKGEEGPYGSLTSDLEIERAFEVVSSGIQRSPRSTPATYTGLASVVRDLYAKLPESRARGYGKSRFSTNVAGGRCKVCKGDGHLRVDQELFSELFVPCEDCQGRRFDRQTLQVRFRGLDIGSLYQLSVDEALAELANIPKAVAKLAALKKVGLGYLQLGQPATSLSGGELQRLVLAREIAKPSAGHCVYLIDEPSLGLHWHDLQVLLHALEELVAQGHTVVLADHHLDLIAACQHLVELGPGPGDAGGMIIGTGSPAELAHLDTPTGRALGQLR